MMEYSDLANMFPEQDDYLPISMLNQLEYCERRFYLMHFLGEMETNVHVLEGTLRHEQVHQAGMEAEGEKIIHRRVYVWSDRLRVSGFIDVVEEMAHTASHAVELIPVEYKKGKMGRWLNDHIQLCAQAICLEERMNLTVPKGYVFYFGSRRREEVFFTPELRHRTEQAVVRARELLALPSMSNPLPSPSPTAGIAERLPPPLTKYAKCRDCSLEPVCLPREISMLLNSSAGFGQEAPNLPKEHYRRKDETT
jgi:CRISPR-associated exonuclease Cas4